eukprot:g1338.t1
MEFLKAQEGHFKPKVKQLTPSKALCYGCQLHCHAAGRLGLDAHVSPSLVSEERFAEILRTLKVRETTSTRQASVAARSTAAAANAGLFAMPQQRADTTQTRFMPHISDLPTEDGLHRAFRGRLTVADFVAGDALLDIVRPRMCVGCGGIQLGDGMRKYRGLDEQGVEMENAVISCAMHAWSHCSKHIAGGWMSN